MKGKKIISLLAAVTMLWNTLSVSADENFNVDFATESQISENTVEIAVNEIYDTSAVISWNEVADCVYEIRLNGEIVTEKYNNLTYKFTDMREGSEYSIDIRAFSVINDELVAEGSQIIHTNLYINSDKNIYNDAAAGTLYLTSGTLSLNGNTLSVENLSLSGGTLDLGGGTLKVSGNVTQTSGTMNVNGGQLLIDGDYSFPSDRANYGYLKMTTANSYVLVGGDFTAGQNYSHKGYLTEGVLEVKGNFTQITNSSGENFSASGNHKVILSGEGKQVVSLQSIDAHFATLELKNYSDEGVEFSKTPSCDKFESNGCVFTYADGSRTGWTLEADEEITGDMILSGGTLDLNGHSLTVGGNLTHTDGTITVNGGSLNILGDYKIQSAAGGGSNGVLNMTNEADMVTVSGSFVMQSTKSHQGLLTAGTLTVGGDFTQKNGSYSNFFTSGNHTTVFNGEEKQTVTLQYSNSGYSHFNNLQLKNTSAAGIELKQNIWVSGVLSNENSVFTKNKIYLASTGTLENGTWDGNLCVDEKRTLSGDETINGTLYLTSGTLSLNGNTLSVENLSLSGGTLDLGGGTLKVSGNVTQTSGTMNVNGGQLLIDGDYSFPSDRANYGYLKMTTANSYVLVGGDFTAGQNYSHKGYLTEGVLEVKGNFTQITNSSGQNFSASGNHKVILSGEGKQVVTFDSQQSQFNILEISKSLDKGYQFSRTPLWNKLIENDTDKDAPSAPQNLCATRVTSSAVVLKWDKSTDNVAVCGYYVYCNGKKIADVNALSYTHEKLKSDTVYQYFVQAYDVELNISEKSNSLTVSTVSSSSAPTAPTNLKAEIIKEGVRLTWSASSSPNLAGYKIYRDDECIGTATGLSYLDKTAEPGIHIYYVRAFDDADNLSNIRNSVTVDNEPPSAPDLSLETISETSVLLKWTSEENDISYYEIYRNGIILKKTTATSFTDSGLSVSEQYEYYVIAYDEGGNASQPSETAAFCSSDTQAPSISAIVPGDGKYSGIVDFTITAQDDIAVSEISIMISADNSDWTEAAVIKNTSRSRKFSVNYTLDTKKFSDGELYIKAFAYDETGNKSFESKNSVAKITICNALPETPEPISLEVNEGYIEVMWGYPDPDTQYFRLYRSNGGEYELLKDNYKYNNYFEENIQIGVKFSYYVTAVNSYGCESLPSEIVDVIIETDDVAPEVLSVYPPSGRSISENQSINIWCRDNYMLKSVSVKLAASANSDSSEIFSSKLSESQDMVDFKLNTRNWEDGIYTLEVTATDEYGNESEPYQVTYKYKSCKLSSPELTVVGSGWRNELSWTIENDEDLAGYIIYRRTTQKTQYELVDQIKGTSYSDGDVEAGQTYFYVIGAVDNRNNVIYSQQLSVVPIDEDDVPPTAYAGIDLYSIAGKSVQFDGSKSFDNRNRIAKYTWDFGDGSTGSGAKASHEYSKEGVYTAVLEVADSAGNTHSDSVTVTVRDAAFCMAEFCITSEGGVKLSDTMIYCEGNGIKTEIYTSDARGKATIFVLTGKYDVYFCKDGYLPLHKEVEITSDMKTVSVSLEEKELITGAITVKELDYSEMKALNIDIHAPENQHVFEYSTTIERKKDGGIEALVFYVNTVGEFVNSERTYTFTDSEGRTSKMFLHVLTKEEFEEIERIPTVAVLTITAGFSWAKEFFDVELTVINNATEEFSIDSSSATLNLPEGLSVADSYLGTELTRNMGKIVGGKSKSASWIVRGDAAGEYELSADFSGMLMPFEKKVTASFKTDEPIVVEAGNALKLEEVRNMIEDWEHWGISYKLINVSDKPVYGVRGSIGGNLGFGKVDDMMIVYPNGRTIILKWNDGIPDYENADYYFDALNYSEDEDIDMLQPGEYVMIYLTLDLELS